MKLFVLLVLSLVALIQCVPFEAAEDFDLVSREIKESKSLFDVATLPNGHHTITVYDEGKYDGIIVEEDDGKCTAYDKDGNIIDLDDDSEDDEEPNLHRRQRRTVIRKLAKFIMRWGRRAWDFINCVGVFIIADCTDEILQCVQNFASDPWGCIETIFCGGRAFRSCV